MKSIIILIPVVTLFAGYGWIASDAIMSQFQRNTGNHVVLSDTIEFDQEKALSALREDIKGREDQPSSEVFENIEVMKKVPAERLLRIMELGFSRSLGVDCTYCHNPNDFADEEKRQKEIARQMMSMVSTINGELLANIDNLESERPTVNCTTCHRGQVKPALNLPDTARSE